jgi:hypothetical protein
MTCGRSLTALLAGMLTAGVCAAQAVTPSISALNPSSVPAGSGAFALSVLGSNFQNGATVFWNGLGLQTSFTSSGQLVASVPASLISSIGSATVWVVNPGDVPSSRTTLTITGPVLSVVTLSPLPSGTAGQAYAQTLAASGGVPPYTWSAGAGMPAGLVINPATGAITGTPSAVGMFSFPVQVTDSTKLVVTQNFVLTINPPPLTITTIPPLFDGIVGTAYSETFSASGGRPPYQWSIISGSSGGLALNPTSGTLQGTPQTAGTFTFTIQVADNVGARVSQSFSLTVTPPSLTILTNATLPPGVVGAVYNQQFSVIGGTSSYTWSLIAGNVPGLAFNASQAALSGAPTTPGQFSFTLQAKDSGGLTAIRTFTISIGPAPLTITTETQLSDGILGASYSFQMSAAGGVPPYTWSATGLPDGLSIDANLGTISGTTSVAQPPPFAVRVIDSARASATNQFRINVSLPPVPAVSISGLTSTVAPAQQFNLQVTLDSIFPTAISGQAILTFSPEVGIGDGTIQFSTGGTTADFTIPAGSSSSSLLAIQTGTVAGQISVSLRLQAGGQDVTPTPAPVISAHIDQAAPVIENASFTRSANGIGIQITGFATAREVTQATFNFGAASGQTLQPSASQITVPVDALFGPWFQNATNSAYGSQFVFTQSFSIQGDASAVTPQSVTLANRKGTTTFPISQ